MTRNAPSTLAAVCSSATLGTLDAELWLEPHALKRWRRFRHRRDRDGFLVARVLTAILWGRLRGRDPDTCCFQQTCSECGGPHGRPRIVGETELWPSWSHSGDLVAAIANGPIGWSEEFNFNGPAIVIGRVGSFCGNVQYTEKNFWSTDNTIVAKPANPEECHFWKGFLQNLGLRNFARGSGQPLLTQSDLKQISVDPPYTSVRVAISGILGSLDDKIAANTRAINSSIALAESLVDRGIRSTRVRLGDVARITMGTSPKGEYLKEEVGGLPFYQGVRDFDDLTPQKRVFTENPVREAEAGDILFAVRAPVGEVNIASEPTAIGRGLAAIRGLKDHVALFYLLRSHPKIWNTHQDNGTVFASINKTDPSNALIPEIEMDQSQSDLLAELHNQSLVLTSQNFILAKTRNELLPLLLSGKISVKEAEQEATAVGADIAGEESEA